MKNFFKSLTVILFSLTVFGQNLPNISTQTRGQLPTTRLSATGIAGMCLETDGAGNVVLQTCSSGGGSGTVTLFSSGSLSPIFTTFVTNPSTTPSLAYILTNANSHTFLGNNTGIAGAPGYVAITANDLPGLGAITINTSNPLGGGGSVALGASLTLTCASCVTSIPQLPITKTAVASNWIRSYDSTTGLFTASQPAYADISGTPQLVNTKAAIASNWINSYSSVTGLFTATQPVTSDLSDFPSQATHSGQFLTTNGTVLSWGSPAGAGTVTSFSSGNLSPLFTTSVATATTTPALTFSLSTAAAHTFFGNNTASTAAPAFASIGNGDLPGSGSITLNTTSPITGGGAVALGGSLTFACASCLTSVTAHNLLSATHGDTTTHSVVRGDLIAGIGVAPTWTAVAKGGTNTYPKWNASGDVISSTLAASGIGSCGANQFETTDNADAAPTCAQPAYSGITGTPAIPTGTGYSHVTSGALDSASKLVNLTASTDVAANQGTTTTLLHGNAAGQPSFASVVSGDLNITTSTCTNQFVTAISSGGVGTCTTDTLASSQHANQGTINTVLHGNASGNPAFSAVTSADTTGTFTATAHNLLSATHGDSTTGTVARGDVITGQGASPTWTRLAKGAASQCLQMDGSAVDIVWGSCATGGSGITTLNTLTASTQTFATGTSGTDFNISSVTSTHTFNIPDASASARGLVTTGTQTFAGAKTLNNELTLAASATGAASQNTPSGTAPTTPAAGDFWRDTNGFNMVESTTTNGSVDVRSDQAGSVGPSSTVRYTADSNIAKTSVNAGALEFNNLSASALTANAIVTGNGNGETQALGSLGTTTTVLHGNAAGAPSFSSVARADLGADAVGWQFEGTATTAVATVSVTPATARKHHMCRLIITSYAGGGGAARAEFGNTSTVDTGANYAFGGFNIASGTSATPTVSGIGSGLTAQEGVPVSGSTTTAGRFVQLNISNSGANIKYFTIETSGVGASAAVTPNLAHIAGTWNNTTNGIGVIQFKACTATTGSCSTVNMAATLTCWGRDDN